MAVLRAAQIRHFKEECKQAQDDVRRILDATRSPTFPAAVPHRYDDKFALVETSCSTGICGLFSVLATVGLTKSSLNNMRDWAASGRTVTLRFELGGSCAFVGKQSREQQSTTRYVAMGATTAAVTTKTDYFWHVELQWKLFAYADADVRRSSSVLELAKRHACAELVRTDTDKAPHPATFARMPAECGLPAFLFDMIDDAGGVAFGKCPEAIGAVAVDTAEVGRVALPESHCGRQQHASGCRRLCLPRRGPRLLRRAGCGEPHRVKLTIPSLPNPFGCLILWAYSLRPPRPPPSVLLRSHRPLGPHLPHAASQRRNRETTPALSLKLQQLF